MKFVNKLINFWKSIDDAYKNVIIFVLLWVSAFALFLIAWNNMFIY